MIEVEIKLPIGDREAVTTNLEKMGFVKGGLVREEDAYFDNHSGQIRKNGEALRVRRITDLLTNQEETVITYKGKKMDQVSMSRKELETGVEDACVCIGIFEALGFQIVEPKVIKTRQEYTLDQMHACVDMVENLGNFLELELVIEKEEGKEAALHEIEKVLQRLGYTLKDTVRNSYLSMLQYVEDE